MTTTRLFPLPGRLFVIRLLVILMLSPALSALAETRAATVIAVRGDSVAIGRDGEPRTLARRSAIFVGDTLRTSADALLQLRFSDQAMMTLSADTEFAIAAYSAADGSEQGSALMELVTGGFRTITGSIGKASGDDYKVTTPTASIGIRGTHYEALVTPDQRLLVGVLDGGVWIRTEYGNLGLGRNMAYSYSVVARGKPPKGLNKAPAELRKPLPGPNQSRTRPPRGKDKPQPGKPAPRNDSRPATSEGTAHADANTRPPPPPYPRDDALGEQEPKPPEPREPEPTGPEPMEPEPTEPMPTEPEPTEPEPTEPRPTEPMPAEPEPTEPEPTEPEPTEPTPAEPEPTEPEPTEPEPTEPEPTEPEPTGPEPTVADPRLTTLENQQLQAFLDPGTVKTLGTVVISGPPEQVPATIIASNTSVPFDYATNGAVSFDLEYFFGDPQTGSEVQTARIVLDSNIGSLADLVADINDDLNAAGAPVRARASLLNPGRLQFFTQDGDSRLAFALRKYQTANSEATLTDLINTLGGVQEGALGQGEQHHQMPHNVVVVTGSDGEPAFIVPESNQSETEPPPEFVDASLVDKFAVGRRGQALAAETLTSVGGRSNISWGYWSASTSTPVTVYEDPATPDVFAAESESVYWLSAEAANIASLTGTASFAATRDFLGSGSSGAVDAVNGSFSVNFDTGIISNGSLGVSTTGDAWLVNFSGLYQNAQGIMKVDSGDIVSGLDTCLSCVEGDLSGIFVAPGDAFAGGFNLRHQEDANIHVEGLMLMEKQ